ncbi:MAG: hypothetical protein ACFCVE_12655 [Phycisphaerae bacterium]
MTATNPSANPAANPSASPTAAEPAPDLKPVEINLVKPNAPVVGRVVASRICTAGRKAAGFVRHVEIDVSGTPLAGKVHAGQSFGVIPPGQQANGKPHKLRLYSVASPSRGEDGAGNVIATTCKRTIDEHAENHTLFLGVCSNYICDLQPGDLVHLTGPAGKRFVLPAEPNAFSYLFMSTGTGIAPLRGFCYDLLENGCDKPITLIAGSTYATDLLYHDEFLSLAQKYPNFRYLTAISREKQADGHDPMYVDKRLQTERDTLLPQLTAGNTLIYICGLLGMEVGIYRQLTDLLKGPDLEQYLTITPEALSDPAAWDRKTIGRDVRKTERVFTEVYD